MTRPTTEQLRVCDYVSFRPRNDETTSTGRGRGTSRAGVSAEAPLIRTSPAEPVPDLTTT